MVHVPFKFSRVGGMSFLRLANLQVSWCITRKECRSVRLTYARIACLAIVLGAGLALI